MKLVLTENSLPRNWSSIPGVCGLIHESDLSIRQSGLKAKLLVFEKSKHLRDFWKGSLGKGNLGRWCRGAVNSLSVEVLCIEKKGGPERKWIEADGRYFCVIGLVKGFLSMEVISHEAVHAGFAFAKRVRRSPWEAQAKSFDEEEICYPAGNIAAEINRAIYDAGLHS